jgi:hypothetical protein
MAILFPCGSQKFTEEQISYEITSDGYITADKAGDYYFSIQGQNRIGKNYPYIIGPITLGVGDNLKITVDGLKWAEEWIYIVIGMGITDDPTTFSQILKIPGKFAGIYGAVLSENFQSAVPPRDYWNYDNYAFIAPYVQFLDAWEQIEYKVAGKNIDTGDADLGFGDTWSVSGNILIDKQLETFTVIATPDELPSVSDAYFSQFTGGAELLPYGLTLNGHMVQVSSTGLIYEYNAYNNAEADNIYYLASDDDDAGGIWSAVDDWGINVQDIWGDYGSHQLLGDGDLNRDNRLVLPNFFINQDSTVESPPIILWLANLSNNSVKKYNRIKTEIRIGDHPASELFSGKIAVTILGYVNLTDMSVRINDESGEPFDNLTKRYFVGSWHNPLRLPDVLNPSEAVILKYELLFEPEEFQGILGIETYIKILPSLVRSTGSFLPFGSMFGPGLILQDGNGYNRRIVPDVGLSANALPGAGIVQGFAFPYQEAQLVGNLPADTANIAIYINAEGYCFARSYTDPPPQSLGYGLRATVSTTAGKSECDRFRGVELNYNASRKLTEAGGLKITVNHVCLEEELLEQGVAQIRGNLPDVVAGYPCRFNIQAFDVIIRRDRFSDVEDITTYLDSTYYEFHNIPLTSNTLYQVVDITDVSTADHQWQVENTYPVSEYSKYFGIYQPPIGYFLDTDIAGDFSIGRYWVGIRYIYSGSCISNISHDPALNHIREFGGGLDKLLEDRGNDRYWDEPVFSVDDLAEYPVQRLWEGKIVLCKAINGLYRFTYYLDAEIPDGHFIIKHNSITSGAWFLTGERGTSFIPPEVILPEGGSLLIAPFGKGLKRLSGRYTLNNYTSPFWDDITYTETELRANGLISGWDTNYYVILSTDGVLHYETEKAAVAFYPNGIILGQISPNTTGNAILYFQHEHETISLDPFSKLILTLDYQTYSHKISPRYKDTRLRDLVTYFNCDKLVVTLKEVAPRWVFIDNLIKWDSLTRYVANKEEYYAWLALHDHLTLLATTLNLPEETFTTNHVNSSLYDINQDIISALDADNKTTYSVDGNDHWEDYINLINYTLVEYEIFDTILATSVFDYNLLYYFTYKKDLSYSGGIPVTQEIVEIDNRSDNIFFGGADSISPNLDVTKNTLNLQGFCNYLFEPPPVTESSNVYTFPESEWGNYTKLPQNWEYGDDTPSKIIPNQYQVYIGFEYSTNSNKIIDVSLNSFLDGNFPRISGAIPSQWQQKLAALYDFISINNNELNFAISQNNQDGVFINVNNSNATLKVIFNSNVFEVNVNDNNIKLLKNDVEI